MAYRATVLGIYRKSSTSASVLVDLRKQGFRRSAMVRSIGGKNIRTDNYALLKPGVSLLGGLLGLLAGNRFYSLWMTHATAAFPGFVLAALGFLLCAAILWLVMNSLGFGVDPALIARYQRWILPDDTLLIFEAQVKDVEHLQELLRQSSETPYIFVFFPGGFQDPGGDVGLPEALPPDRLIAFGRQLASSQPVVPRQHRGRPLLERLHESERILTLVRQHLAEAVRIGQSILLSAEWLLDNAYVVQEQIDDFRRGLPRRYYEQLPVLAQGPFAGLPRVYGIAAALVECTDARLNRDNLQTFLQAYQSITPLTIGELWALPLMLRLRLIERLKDLARGVDRRQRERERADFWANRLLTAARDEPDHLLAFVAELAREQPAPSSHLADQLIEHLYDEEAALASVRNWLERKLAASLQDAFAHEQHLQTIQQVGLGNAITSLRQLGQLDWSVLFEQISRIDVILWTDPAEIYPNMDFATRDQCRHALEEIARYSAHSEVEVAQETLALASEHGAGVMSHVGYYLLDAGRPLLETRVGSVPRFSQRLRRWARRHPSFVYFCSVGIVTMLLLALLVGNSVRMGMHPLLTLLPACFGIFPASEIALQIVNFLVTRLLPPIALPKMSFEQGIPDSYRSLVVVPMMLLTPESIREEAGRLEIRFLANPDPNLRYALLSDYSDAPEQHMPEDAERLEVAIRCIAELNERHGENRFFLFHRERVWSESESRWMGWERKRGKLETMNRFLMGETGPELDRLLQVGDPDQLRGIRFVITLDADTQLPRDTARRLIETLAHPLNQPEFAPGGRALQRGYTIIQPRVSTSLPSATGSLFSRLFTDPTGTDPYTRAISDVYQDLAGEGSYHGKGIYDLAAFHQQLTNRFPPAHLLSHDLIEGAHVCVGLASDIELFDFFPKDYIVYSGRQHRWVRGDWQIMDWLSPQVPNENGEQGPNPLGMFNRWKILDNLRRSLLPAASVALLLLAWLLSPTPASWSWLVAGMLFIPALLQTFTMLLGSPRFYRVALRDIGISLVRGGIQLSLLLYEAGLNLDAIGRVLYRRLVSHKLLLEWETAHEAHQRSKNRQRQFLIRLARISMAALAVALYISFRVPQAENVSVPFLGLWIITPLVVSWLDTATRRLPARSLSGADKANLRILARQTWRFFDDFVGPQTNWLPPDNYQAILRVEVAPRTSPTNIGLWLLTLLAANDFGYLSLDTMLERMAATTQTLEKLEKAEGHLLNWYDITNCRPLYPRYISMVDSGNLLGNLWALEQGVTQLLNGPILCPSCLDGLKDTLSALRQVPTPEGTRDSLPTPTVALLEAICSNPPSAPDALIRRLRSAQGPVKDLLDVLKKREGGPADQLYWAEKIEQQISDWNSLIDRYLKWMEILDDVPSEGLLALGSSVHEWRRQALAGMPSLRVLAGDHVPGLAALVAVAERAHEYGIGEETRNWLQSLVQAASHARWLAGEKASQADAVVNGARNLSDGMNMRFLYDSDRRIFVIGYNVEERRHDASFYDLLASEARLGSFCAIARGEVPMEHWFALGRPFVTAYGQRALLSWSGTMFEYLMPLLLTRSFENSLLDQACRSAVLCQIAYGRKRGIPWGISEAAYSALDARQIYQYRAFGVPGLGLKRGLEEDLVVAPYASALSLQVLPKAAYANLVRLERLTQHQLRSAYGFCEALDYTRQHDPQGDPGVIVQTYMAHHQGMTLLAIDNTLHNNIMQDRFHADPRVQATESLLYERIPSAPALVRDVEGKVPLPRLVPTHPLSSEGRIDTANTVVPRTQLLSNSDYSVMVTNAGSGYSCWKETEITRWRADTTRDSYGQFLYLKDLDSNQVWTPTAQPMGGTPRRYSVLFTLEKAEFRRREFDIETVLDIVVSPEDNAEIRRLTLINHSFRERRLELTSYMEIALASHSADRAHPAFSKLFIQTEALPDWDALLAWRRPRAANDPIPWAVHVLATANRHEQHPLHYETDRARFLGRGRSAANPAALQTDLTNSIGAVLDPIFSLRREIELQPGERLQVAFVTGAGGSREVVTGLAEKYCDLNAVNHALELAWTHAQLDLRHLRIQPEEALRFQQFAGYMLYPSASLRPPEERIRRNSLGQPHLWTYGISGDLPIVVVTIGDANDLDVVRQALMAHTYWRVRGLKCDLLILNEEASSYEQPLQEQIRRLIGGNTTLTGIDQPGGVFLRPAAQIPEQDLTLILSTARVVLIAARGGFAQQLGNALPARVLPPALPRNARIGDEPSPPLPFMELPYFNGLGGFTPDGKEYVIYLGPNATTPLPWINVMANPRFGTFVSESGSGYSWYGNSQSNRLTPWSNDPVSDPTGDAIYLRDEDLGVVWTPTALPIRELDAYRTHHGQGYSLFEHNSHAIEQELTTFVPITDMLHGDGPPVRIQKLRLRNAGGRRRRLSVTAYVEWALGVEREDTQIHIVTGWDNTTQILTARNTYHPDFGGRVAFLASATATVSYTGDRTEFLGRNGSPAHPAALDRTRLSNRIGAGLDPCGAVQTLVELDPGQTIEITFLLGEADTLEEARSLVSRFRNSYQVETALSTTKAWWEKTLGTITVTTPDLGINFLLNRWLLYQDLSCRIWGRSAFYQSGGAYGFRDQLQDVMALIYTDPALTRAQILRSAARQFLEGDVQHWWHPPGGAGVRTRISDDLLWLPFVTAHYVRVTGDATILDEQVPFLEGKPLEANEHEVFNVPILSEQKASLLEHCRRSITKGLTSGPHGLPLIGAGDWNDGLNRVGIEGKGESVWLAWFIVHVLHDFAELLRVHGSEPTGKETGAEEAQAEAKEAEEMLAKAAHLVRTIEAEAWDGAWYRRAYFDDGTPLGSAQSEEAQIDSLPQSWAVISGAGDPVRAEQALRSVEEHLASEQPRMLRLFTPAFDKTSHDPGYIKGYLPGVRENGGQYTHGSLWVPLAFARRGEGDKAVHLLGLMNPIEHARTLEAARHYKVEPYVVVADIYALAGQEGRGGWTWYTGSAGWMYRVWIEEVLGFTLRGKTLHLNPSIPAAWNGFSLHYRYGESEYTINIENPDHVQHGVAELFLDERLLSEPAISLSCEKGKHTVRIRMGHVGQDSMNATRV